jgi:hypothetical protein
MWAALSIIAVLAGSTMAIVGPPEDHPTSSATQVQPNEPLVAKTADSGQPRL